MKNESQMFRFCCRCTRVSLITDNGCYFCEGKFILQSKRDDLNIREKKYAETH